MIETIERRLTPTSAMEHMAEQIFRVSVSLIFIIGGLGHFGQHQMMLDRMAESPWRDTVASIGDPSILLWLSGAVFVIFGITLALGFAARFSALIILLTLIPITFFTHVAPGHTGPLFKNIAIMGALVLLIAKSGGAYSIGKGRRSST